MATERRLTGTWAGCVELRRGLAIETRWVGRDDGRPPLVFLHEGLGSVAMWRDFPARLCERLGLRGLVYSRPGYGRSTPRRPDEHWGPDFLHRQAELLAELLPALGVHTPPWLFGHSDGASIALLFAARWPTAGCLVMAPHIDVEAVAVESIARTREAYLNTDLRARLARHHADVDSAFWGWNDIWLDARFREWRIHAELASIRCPVLALQGVDDEYGTLAQIHGIRDRVPTAELLTLPACGHSPHRDQPDRVLDACAEFLARHQGDLTS